MHLDLLAMYLPGSRWKETNLASAVHLHTLLVIHLVGSLWKESACQRRACTRMFAVHLDLLAMRLPGSRWKETNLANAVHVHELLAIHLVGNRWKNQLCQRRACT